MQKFKGVFISYRRSDGSGWADHIHSWIRRTMPDVPIFMDIDTIRPGEDFVDKIERSLSNAAIFLVIIGRNWLEDSQGILMLDNPDDFVRLEVEKALASRIPVIPVLVDGAGMPGRDQLPESLHSLLRKQAITIHTDDREAGIQKVVNSVKIYIDEQKTEQEYQPSPRMPSPARSSEPHASKKWWLIAAGIIAVFFIFYFLQQQQQQQPYTSPPYTPPEQPIPKTVHAELAESAIVGSHQPDLARAYGEEYVGVIMPCLGILQEGKPPGWEGMITLRWSVVEKNAPFVTMPHNENVVILSESLGSGEATACIVEAIASHPDQGIGQNYGVDVICAYRVRVQQ